MLQPCPWMPHTLQCGHTTPQPGTLLVLLHGWGARAEDMGMLAQALGDCRPQTLTLAPQGFTLSDVQTGARQWFDVRGMTPHNRQQRIDAVLPRMAAWISTAQAHTGVSCHNTALAGFSQGASLALALVSAHERFASRVFAFSGRPPASLRDTAHAKALHFFTGALDPLLPVATLSDAVLRLHNAGNRVTLDVAEQLGHGINGQLLDRARAYLTAE
ncbi:MAG: esterase [Burkholderiales bacterium PBB4]|nr:MAG: esterase [Burkholderiales bacterium PBB4]